MEQIALVFAKVIDALLLKISDPLTLIVMLLAGYFAYDRQKVLTSYEAHRKENSQTISELQQALIDKHAEDKRQLLEILDKYHANQLDITEALTQMRHVLMNLGGKL